jgi:hypothetical protein
MTDMSRLILWISVSLVVGVSRVQSLPVPGRKYPIKSGISCVVHSGRLHCRGGSVPTLDPPRRGFGRFKDGGRDWQHAQDLRRLLAARLRPGGSSSPTHTRHKSHRARDHRPSQRLWDRGIAIGNARGSPRLTKTKSGPSNRAPAAFARALLPTMTARPSTIRNVSGTAASQSRPAALRFLEK